MTFDEVYLKIYQIKEIDHMVANSHMKISISLQQFNMTIVKSYCPFWLKIFHQTVCTYNSSYMSDRNSSKLSMLDYYHKNICIQCFIKSLYTQLFLNFKREFLKTLYLITIWRFAYCFGSLIRAFLKELFPFLSRNISS